VWERWIWERVLLMRIERAEGKVFMGLAYKSALQDDSVVGI